MCISIKFDWLKYCIIKSETILLMIHYYDLFHVSLFEWQIGISHWSLQLFVLQVISLVLLNTRLSIWSTFFTLFLPLGLSTLIAPLRMNIIIIPLFLFHSFIRSSFVIYFSGCRKLFSFLIMYAYKAVVWSATLYWILVSSQLSSLLFSSPIPLCVQ